MIGQGIKNFFKSLKYFFTPLGTTALGFVIGISILIPGVAAAVDTLVASVKNILSDTSIDFNSLKDCLTSAVQALDWNEPIAAVQTMISAEWLTSTLTDCVASLIESSEAFTSQIGTAVVDFSGTVVSLAVIVVVFTVLGIVGGFWLTKWLIRRDIARRSVWKYLLASFIDSLLAATLVALCAWLVSLWKPSIFISTIISFLLFGFIALLEAYLVHGYGKISFGKIVNADNIAQLLATDILILLCTGAICAVAVAITNALVGAFIGIALAEIAFVVMGLNAEAYVKSASGEAIENQPPTQPPGTTTAQTAAKQ